MKTWTHGEAIEAAYKMLPENEVTSSAPYTIMVTKGAFNMSTVRLTLIQTDGTLRPKKIDPRCRSFVKFIYRSSDCVVTSREGCKIHTVINEMVALRDVLNKKAKVTPEFMRSLISPKLRQMVVEAICINAI
jgi:hypothetical protein